MLGIRSLEHDVPANKHIREKAIKSCIVKKYFFKSKTHCTKQIFEYFYNYSLVLSIDFYRNDCYSNYKRDMSNGRHGMAKESSLVSEIIDNIRRVFQVVNEQSKKARRETGITGPQLWAIKVLAESSSLRVSDLARRMYLHPATVVGILNRLERKGLIKRVRTNDDRRIVKVELTDAGISLIAKAPQVAQGLLVAGLEVLPIKTLQEINDSLGILVHILGVQELPPQLILSSELNLPDKRRQKKEVMHTKLR